jgi:hypothetical protein
MRSNKEKGVFFFKKKKKKKISFPLFNYFRILLEMKGRKEGRKEGVEL